MKRMAMLGLVAVMAGAACGGDGSSAGAQDGAALRALEQEVTTALAAYEGEMATAPDPATCTAAYTRYRTALDPRLDRLRQGWDELDRELSRQGRGQEADLGCMASAMESELARHGARTCTLADPAANAADATVHVATLSRWMEHQRVRSGHAGRGQGAGAGATFACEERADETFTLGGHPWAAQSCPARDDCAASCDCGSSCADGCATTCAPGDRTCLSACRQSCASECRSACVAAARCTGSCECGSSCFTACQGECSAGDQACLATCRPACAAECQAACQAT